MTSPRHAFQLDDKGRYYRHPVTGQELVSVTNVLSVGFAKHGLIRWAANAAADHVLDNLPTVVARSRADRIGVRTEIATAYETIRDSASNLGTRVHALADAHLTGKQLAEQEGDREAGLYVAQYIRFLADFDVNIERHVVASELTVADPAAGYAGTLDAILRLKLDGFVEGKVKATTDEHRGTWLIDIKTSRTRSATESFPDNRLQLAALRHAREAWLPDDSIDVMPKVNACAVLQLRERTYELIPMPASTTEYRVFLNTLANTRWLHDQWPGNYGHRPVTPNGGFKAKRGAKTTTTKEEAA